MNLEQLYLLSTYMATPTLTCSPCDFSPLAPHCLTSPSLDLQNGLSHEQVTTMQILFPGKETKENLQKSIVSSEFLDSELNYLRLLILSQPNPVLAQQFPQDLPLADNQPQISFAMTVGMKEKELESKEQNASEDITEKKVGIYTKVERERKIRKYKKKLKKWRTLHPISRNFEGRRRVAFTKIRNNGRFFKIR
eukprot:TRINITY_DN6619_c0_g2_i3.p1 TRINITY_DN6619_c0_g2~~TRINITY_DN6619_c0_g2_i3.p1  ORF type:complete len:194 (+),score=43.46 TRINITY_DN6619_c0_g2_i3:218-799(+)